MSSQSRPLEATFVLSAISVALSTLGRIFYIPAPLTYATIVYHVVIGLAHLRVKCLSVGVNRSGTESPLVTAIAYANDVCMNIWRSAVAGNRVRLEDEEAEPRACLHPTASLTSLVVVCLLIVAWSMLLGIAIGFNVDHRGLNLRLWITMFGILTEVMVLVASARICQRMRNNFFVQIEGIATPGGEKVDV